MDGCGKGLEAPPGLLPFLIHLCRPSCHGQPRSLALLGTTEWISKGKDLWDHPGLRWPEPERWLGRGWSCRADGLGLLREGLGTSLQDRGLLAPPTCQPGTSLGGEQKQVTEAAVLCQLCPAGGSRSAWMGTPLPAPREGSIEGRRGGVRPRVSRASWVS